MAVPRWFHGEPRRAHDLQQREGGVDVHDLEPTAGRLARRDHGGGDMANAGTDARITWQHSSIIAFQSFHRTRDARRATVARHRLVVRGDRERRPPGRVHDMTHMTLHRITGRIAFHSRRVSTRDAT